MNEIDSLVKGKSQHMTQPIMTIISLPQIQFVALLSTFFPRGTRYLDKPMDPIYFYPDEGAKLMIELHQQKNQTYGIKVNYLNISDRIFIVLLLISVNSRFIIRLVNVRNWRF